MEETFAKSALSMFQPFNRKSSVSYFLKSRFFLRTMSSSDLISLKIGREFVQKSGFNPVGEGQIKT